MHCIASTSCKVCIFSLYGFQSCSAHRSYPRHFSIDYDLKMQEMGSLNPSPYLRGTPLEARVLGTLARGFAAPRVFNFK